MQSLSKLSPGFGLRHAPLKPNIQRDAAERGTMAALAVIDGVNQFVSHIPDARNKLHRLYPSTSA